MGIVIILSLLSLKLEKAQPDWNKLWQDESVPAAGCLPPLPVPSPPSVMLLEPLPTLCAPGLEPTRRTNEKNRQFSLYLTCVWHIVGIKKKKKKRLVWKKFLRLSLAQQHGSTNPQAAGVNNCLGGWQPTNGSDGSFWAGTPSQISERVTLLWADDKISIHCHRYLNVI